MDVLVRLDSIHAPGVVLMGAIEARKRWARRMMEKAGGTAPAYGTTAWLELPEGDVAKVAAVVRAAECWAGEGDDLEESLRTEIAAARLAFKRDEDADYVARRDKHRQRWEGLPQDVERAVRRDEQRRRWLGGEAS